MVEDGWPDMANGAVAEQKKSHLLKREEKQSFFAYKSTFGSSVKKKSLNVCNKNSWYLNPIRFSSWLRLTRLV